MRNQELQTRLNSALAMIGTLDTHYYFAREMIVCQQKKIYAQDNKKILGENSTFSSDEIVT